MARRTISKAKIKLPRELEELVQWAINGGDLAPRVHDVLRAAMLRMTIAETANALDLSEQSVRPIAGSFASCSASRASPISCTTCS
jgi:hypothetical protein